MTDKPISDSIGSEFDPKKYVHVQCKDDKSQSNSENKLDELARRYFGEAAEKEFSPLLCSGHGQYHTDEPGKDNRKPYALIDFKGIQSLVDTPQQIDKQHAQWLIPSTLLSHTP